MVPFWFFQMDLVLVWYCCNFNRERGKTIQVCSLQSLSFDLLCIDVCKYNFGLDLSSIEKQKHDLKMYYGHTSRGACLASLGEIVSWKLGGWKSTRACFRNRCFTSTSSIMCMFTPRSAETVCQVRNKWVYMQSRDPYHIVQRMYR